MKLFIAMALFAASCKLGGVASFHGPSISTGNAASSGSSSGGATGESPIVTIPDLHGLSHDDAIAAMRKAGITAELAEEFGPCSEQDLPHGRVCNQTPGPGQQSRSDLQISVWIQSDSPESTTPGVDGARYEMPDVIGMTEAQAKAKLAAAGFSDKDKFDVAYAWDCKQVDVICRSDPAPGETTTTRYNKVLYMGTPKDRPTSAHDLF
ncbi:MAG TPA: PASTA domain-containing protein [Kofleriaceae bacterium]|jgi:beta-lactam-binding protein with PASTA domain|nr:PASTA domain-containing protein [Kofleriaceae bacterium]